jgi:uncharacterized protein (DUF302 family)
LYFPASPDQGNSSQSNLVYRVLENGQWSRIENVFPAGSAQSQNDAALSYYAVIDAAGRAQVVWNALPDKWHPELTKVSGTYHQHLVGIGNGLVFEATLDGLIEAIAHSGMTLFARIDHAAAALAIGTPMPPTTVLIYGSPAGGTPLMLAAPLAALDLPLRVLVREDEQGRVTMAFHPMARVLRRAGVPDAQAQRLERAQLNLLEALA